MNEEKLIKKSVRFGVDILKYDDEDGEHQQKIVICLRRDGDSYSIVSPATSLVKCFASASYKTQYEYDRRVAEFLNYAYFSGSKITSFNEISTETVIGFLNYLAGTGHNRSYVKESKRILTKMFWYTSYYYGCVCQIENSEFVFEPGKKNTVIKWPKVDTEVLLPSAKTDVRSKRNKISNLDTELVLRFIELSIDEAPNCSLGFYFIFFAGIRADEALHLTSADIPRQYGDSTYFSINLCDKILNMDSKTSDIAQNKRPRRQMVLYVPKLYMKLYNTWADKYSSGPIVRNHSGKAMTIAGFEYNFNKVKRVLLEKLRAGDAADHMRAFKLEQYSWSTHIGRGFFSNLVGEHSGNPYLVSVARGDSRFDSALPYIEDSEATVAQIKNGLSEMYEKISGGRDEKSTNL